MVEEHWLDINELRIHYLKSGKAGSRVLFLHGGSEDSASLSWRPTLARLSQEFRSFAPDLPGYGNSAKPKRDYTTEYYGEFVTSFARRLDLEHFSLVGLSTGGQISLGLALRFPERLHKLVLISTAGLGTQPQWRLLARVMVKMPKLHSKLRKTLARRRETVKLVLQRLLCDHGAITDELLDEILETNSLPGAGRAWRSYLQNEVNWSGFRNNFLHRLENLAVPTLLIHGSHDRLIPAKWARKAHQLIPDSQLCVLQQCGHWPQREKPEDFHNVLVEFLKDGTAGSIGSS